MKPTAIGLGVVLAAFVSLIGPPGVSAQTLYAIGHIGPDGPSTFYTVNTSTGSATAIGAVGFERCGGMDAGPGNELFAVCERSDGSNIWVLVTIDPATGAGTEVGPLNTTGSMSDISFRAADGVLFMFNAANDPDHRLFTVSTTTGAATLVGSTGLSIAGGNAMAFGPGDDVLYHSNNNWTTFNLHSLNQTTGLATLLGTMTMPYNDGDRFNAFDLDPSTGLLWGLLNTTSGNSYLATVNPSSFVITVVGQSVGDLDALSFDEYVPVQLQSFSVE